MLDEWSSCVLYRQTQINVQYIPVYNAASVNNSQVWQSIEVQEWRDVIKQSKWTKNNNDDGDEWIRKKSKAGELEIMVNEDVVSAIDIEP